jgi:hypothetical protein
VNGSSETRCRSSPVNLDILFLPQCADRKLVAQVGRNDPSCHVQVLIVLTGSVHSAGLDLHSRRRPHPVQAPQTHEGLQSRGQRCSSPSISGAHRVPSASPVHSPSFINSSFFLTTLGTVEYLKSYPECWIQPTMQRIQLSGQVNVASFPNRLMRHNDDTSLSPFSLFGSPFLLEVWLPKLTAWEEESKGLSPLGKSEGFKQASDQVWRKC